MKNFANVDIAKRYALLLLPILSLVCYLLTNLYVFSFLTTFSCLFIVCGFSIGMNRRMDALLLSVAFVFSIAGDWMLGHAPDVPMHFVYGVALFFVAHLGYIAYSLHNGRVEKKMLYV